MCVSLSVLRAYIFLVSMVSLHLILVKKIKKGILASQRAGRSHGFEKTSFRFPFPPRPARPFFRIIHVIFLFLLVDIVASSRPTVLETWSCCGVVIVGGHCSIFIWKVPYCRSKDFYVRLKGGCSLRAHSKVWV